MQQSAFMLVYFFNAVYFIRAVFLELIRFVDVCGSHYAHQNVMAQAVDLWIQADFGVFWSGKKGCVNFFFVVKGPDVIVSMIAAFLRDPQTDGWGPSKNLLPGHLMLVHRMSFAKVISTRVQSARNQVRLGSVARKTVREASCVCEELSACTDDGSVDVS